VLLDFDLAARRAGISGVRLVYLILAESRLILPEAQAPQPDHNVPDGRPQSVVTDIICRGHEGVQDGVRYRISASRLTASAADSAHHRFMRRRLRPRKGG
jgi:hypothetical protein